MTEQEDKHLPDIEELPESPAEAEIDVFYEEVPTSYVPPDEYEAPEEPTPDPPASSDDSDVT